MSTFDLNPDGPRTAEYAIETASAFSESVRVLNHLTHGGAALENTSTTYDVTGRLAGGAYGLPQLCGQLHDDLIRRLELGRVGVDSGGDPAPAIEAAAAALREAARLAETLGDQLQAAQQALGQLHDIEPPPVVK